jgi:hypothetical protein
MTNGGTIVLIGGVMAWSIYRRIRRNIGQQRLRPVRITISIVIFSLVSLLFLALAIHDMRLLAGIGGGLALGAGLGFVGLKLTRFETTDAGHFYTPNTYIGVGLSVLFLGRLAYRYMLLSDPNYAQDHPQAMQSPLTFFIFGLVAGYYIVYYIGLFVHTHDKKPLAATGTVPPVLTGTDDRPQGI